MSISFSTNRKSTHIGYHIVCYGYGSESNWKSKNFLSKTELFQTHQKEHIDNPDCDFSNDINQISKSFDTDMDPELQVSNGNGLYILQTLGFEQPEYTGVLSADDFKGRVLLAEALSPVDEGLPSYQLATNGATIYNCGRAPGYLQDKLIQLLKIAEFAKANNSDVTWG
jgi:hypothetical protein